MAALEVVDDPVALLTITGPGWDELQRDPSAIKEWNRTAAERFRRLDRTAKSRLRVRGLKVRPLARIAQRQRRGVDHLHIALADARGNEEANRAYHAALLELAPRFGFGFSDDPYRKVHPKLPNGRPNRSRPKRDRIFEDPAVAGRYLSRYLADDSGQLAAMLEQGDHSFRPLWVAPELTQASGVNCRRLRRVRHAHFVLAAVAQGSRPSLPIWWRDLGERMAVIRLVRPHPARPPNLAQAA